VSFTRGTGKSINGGAKNARLENAGLGWKTRERIGYGKPIKPKQLTHFYTDVNLRGMTAADSGLKKPNSAEDNESLS